MEEFIENFQEFRDYLYSIKSSNYDFAGCAIKDIIDKFEELNLNNAF